ncbi:MAG: hypothetical protein EBZ59_05275 [Planctomycetia bacterium]|nr:hypothetical protein [Planctomycetia bacterium]
MRVCRMLAAAAALGVGCHAAPSPAAEAGDHLRVESEIYVNEGAEPVARSLTLFCNGVVWDFLESSDCDAPAGGAQAADEIVLHDPVRERVVVIDPGRNLKTQVASLRLERLGVSLASWARTSEDRLIRWAGGPDFGDGFQEQDGRMELVGPRVRYEVEFAAAPSPEAAESYRRFADTAILLKALLHPGGIPPFPRLAINRRVCSAGGIPTLVTLEIDPKMAMLAGRPDRLRSVHRIHPRLLAGDFDRIEEAQARVAIAESVDLAKFCEPSSATVSERTDASPVNRPAEPDRRGT